MWFTYRAVHTLERRSQHYQYNTRTSPSKSERLARQSYLYVGALYLTNLPLIVTRVTQFIAGVTYYGMMLSIAILVPMQGFWNVIVYLRPRYLKARDGRSSGSRSLTGFFWKAASKTARKGDTAVEKDDEETESQLAHDPTAKTFAGDEALVVN